MAASMQGYQVTLPVLTAAAATVNSTAEEISAQLAALAGYVQGMADFWRGSAAGQFQVLMEEYQRYSAMLNEGLAGIGRGLAGNHSVYSDAEVTNTCNISKIELPAANFAS